MIKIPSEIKIGPHTIPISRENRQDNTYGTYNGNAQKINIVNNISKTLQVDTFIHEIIEAIDHLHDLKLYKLSHSVITTLGCCIAQALENIELEPINNQQVKE